MKQRKLFVFIFSLLFMQACAAGDVKESQTNNTRTTNSVASKPTKSYYTHNIKQEREVFYEQKLRELRSQNATLQANQAIQNKNAYLMALSSGRAASLNIPGFTQPELDRLKCRVDTVNGGDTIYGKNHLSYIKELRQFMLEFNTRMRLYCV